MGLALSTVGCISNPGEFTITVLPGSLTLMTDASGTPTLALQHGSPACDDQVDNDIDDLSDFGNDPDCASAVDANERLSGLQAYTPTVIPIDIDGAGAITGDPTELVNQQSELCIYLGGSAGVWCLGVTLVGFGSSQTGTFNGSTNEITINLPLTMKLVGLVGFSGLPSTCEISPIDATFVGDDYNTTTGETTLRAIDVDVPAATGCGSYDGAINGHAALPGEADIILNTTILDGSGNPIAVS